MPLHRPRPAREARAAPVRLPARPRVRVIGASGSGKTTLARRAAERLGVAHLELDAVFWDRDWQMRDAVEARDVVRRFVDAHPEGWVGDGNWSNRLEGMLDPPSGSDLVVWLDPPRSVVLARVVRRTLWRGLTRRELWHGNRERPRTWLSRDPEQNIVLWSWRSVPRLRADLAPRVGTPGFVRLSTRREVRRWLEELTGATNRTARPPRGPGT